MAHQTEWLHGVFPALVSPFQAGSEDLDLKAFRSLLGHVLPEVNGVVTSGSTGEFPYLDRDEKRCLVETAVAEAGNKPVIAGCGAASTSEAITLVNDAREAGAAAALVVTPYFLHPSGKGIYQHYYEIATKTDLPVILYNIPQLVDQVLPREVIEDLADLPNIIGLKDSSGNLAWMMEVMEYAGDRLDILVGNDEVVLPALAAGAEGMILGSAQVFPDIWQEVMQLAKSGNIEQARACQAKVQKLSRIFARYGGGVAVKAALKMTGLDMGPPRQPLKSVGGALIHETRAEIRLELEKLGMADAEKVSFQWPGGKLEERFTDLEISPDQVREYKLRTGTGNSGDALSRVQIDIIAGRKDTPLGDAYAFQLTYPLHGREALSTILEPGLTVRPSTLLLPALPQKNLRQANMIYGPAQWGVARAIVDAVEAGIIPGSTMEDEVMVALVTLHPQALDRHELSANVLQAATTAISSAFQPGQQEAQ